jgi:hypothetical protein
MGTDHGLGKVLTYFVSDWLPGIPDSEITIDSMEHREHIPRMILSATAYPAKLGNPPLA